MSLRGCLAILLGLTWGLSGPVAADCTKVVMTADPDYPPLSWADDKGLRGVSFDLAALALDRLGVAYEIRAVGPFPRILREAQKGEIDLITSLKNIEERRAYLAFTDTPIARNPIAVFVRAGAQFPYQGRDDLRGLRGAMVQGNRFGEDFDAFLRAHLTIDPVAGIRQAFQMLERGRVDYVLTGYLTGQSYIVRNHREDAFTSVRPFVTDAQNFAAFVKTSPCAALLPQFDAILAELIAQGEFDRLLKKNLTALGQGRDKSGDELFKR